MSASLPLGELERAASVLAAAATPSEVFRSLLETAALAAPRTAILLLRHDQVKGWGSSGYNAGASQRLRALVAPASTGWIGELVATEQRGLLRRGSEHGDPDFGQVAGETIGAPLRVGGKTVALLVAEREPGGEPWQPEALAVLITIAEIRLELDLARRKIRRLQEERVKGSPAASPRESGGLVEAPAADAPAPPAERDPARRYARLIATDIRLYNEEAVMTGRSNRDLAERLREQLERGRETFLRRYPDLGPAGMEILHEAFVQVLAAGDHELLPTAALR